MVWFLQYKYDEASSGTTPTTVADSGGGTAVDLTITYGAGAWTSIAAGNGLTARAARATFTDGNKLFDAADGARAFTWEIVINVGTMPEAINLPVWFTDVTDGEHVFGIVIESDGRFKAISENLVGGAGCVAESATGQIANSTVYVIHAVFDLDHATTADRLRIYRNGSRVTPSTAYTAPTAAIDADGGTGTNAELLINSAFGAHSGGTVYWLAGADHAADDAEVSDRATSLAADNDTAPAAGPVIVSTSPADNATGVSRTANLSITYDQNITAGTGNVYIWNGTRGALFESFAIGDGRVSISTDTVTFNPAGTFAYEEDYYVLLDAGAITGADGITDSTFWNFRVVALLGAGTSGGFLIGSASSLVGVAYVGAQLTQAAPLLAVPTLVGSGF